MELGVRILIRVVFLAEGSICLFDLSFGGLLVYSKKLGRISTGNVEESYMNGSNGQV